MPVIHRNIKTNIKQIDANYYFWIAHLQISGYEYHIIYLSSLFTGQPDLDLQEYVLPPGILHHIDDKLRQTDGEPRRNFAVVQVAATKQYSFRQIDFWIARYIAQL